MQALFVRGCLGAVLLSFVAGHAQAQSVFKVKEINSTPRFERADDSRALALDGKVLIAIGDSELGNELAVSDGTQAGTQLLMDINPGPRGSNPGNFVRIGSFFYFDATTEANGEEIWRTDGTPAGTTLFAEVRPGPESSNPAQLTALGNKLVFRADTGANGRELCFIDTAVSSAVSCTNINPGGDSSPTGVRVIGAIVLFAASDGVQGEELYRTNGTVAGTQLIKDINPGAAGSFPSDFVLGPLGTVLFSASSGASGFELWRTNGSSAGTVLVKDINPASGQSSFPSSLTFAGDRVYFSADDGINGRELWASTGLEAGTVLVEDIIPGPNSSQPSEFIAFDNKLFFRAESPGEGVELFSSQGEAFNTVRVKDINPGPGSSFPNDLIVINGKLYFGAESAAFGEEPWVSDGSTLGTSQLIDFTPGAEQSSVDNVIAFNNKALFLVGTSATGDSHTVFVASDGSVAGTAEAFRLLRPGSANARVGALARAGARLVFAAVDGVSGEELHVSDGSAAGTALLLDTKPGAFGSLISTSTSTGNKAFFDIIQPIEPGRALRRLFITDGTSGGTNDIAATEFSGSSDDLADSAELGGKLIFANIGSLEQGSEPWISDGTAQGTQLLKNIVADAPFSFGSAPRGFTRIGDQVLFSAVGLSEALWRTDGTPGGTVRIGNFFAATVFRSPPFLTLQNEALFAGFSGFGFDVELLKTDGTEAGTTIVKNINNPGASFPQLIGVLNNRVIFSADRSDIGRELWISDGTDAGTVLLKEITPGVQGTDFTLQHGGTVFNGKLYFTINIPDQTVDLWSTDGTTAGTAFVAKIRTVPGSPDPRLITFDGRLFFVGEDSLTGDELWSSDGTPAGTGIFRDLAPGTEDSLPQEFTPVGDSVFFAAEEAQDGRELYLLVAANDACPFNLAKSAPGSCGCEVADVDNNLNGVVDCLDPTVLTVPGIATISVRRRRLSFSLPPVVGARFEIFIKNRKGKVLRVLVSEANAGVIKRLKFGRFRFSYRILFGDVITQSSAEKPFRVKRPRKR